MEFPADRFSELALQHSVTRGKAFEQLCTAATAKTPTAQVLEMKRLVPLVATTGSIAERRLLAACVAELLLVPHPFAFHTQLKLSLGALCSAEAEAERVLHDTLSARLAALVALRSLCPGGRVLPGVLRKGSMPGWLPLLLDAPAGLVLLRAPMQGPLLRLVRARARARASARARNRVRVRVAERVPLGPLLRLVARSATLALALALALAVALALALALAPAPALALARAGAHRCHLGRLHARLGRAGVVVC